MKFLFVIIVLLLSVVSAQSATLADIQKELAALYTVVSDPKKIQTFEAGKDRVDEYEMRLYQVTGNLATEEACRVFVVQATGQAFYARSLPSKLQPQTP